MHTIDDPWSMPEAPSARRLFRSTLIALGVAIAILVTIVLPAEYGVDPTGVGRLLGLEEMGEIKMRLAREAAGHEAEAVASAAATSEPASLPPSGVPTPVAVQQEPSPVTGTSDVTEIILLPSQAKEIKLVMKKDARVIYSWATNRGVVNYDTHADAPGIDYHGYGKGTGKASNEGVLVAAFDGAHGWFWRNRTADTITITLKTNGDYQALKRLP